jgi:hypothetical protein
VVGLKEQGKIMYQQSAKKGITWHDDRSEAETERRRIKSGRNNRSVIRRQKTKDGYTVTEFYSPYKPRAKK